MRFRVYACGFKVLGFMSEVLGLGCGFMVWREVSRFRCAILAFRCKVLGFKSEV